MDGCRARSNIHRSRLIEPYSIIKLAVGMKTKSNHTRSFYKSVNVIFLLVLLVFCWLVKFLVGPCLKGENFVGLWSSK